eukprot:jgi/Ulvmu1/7040/UM033_0099.1
MPGLLCSHLHDVFARLWDGSDTKLLVSGHRPGSFTPALLPMRGCVGWPTSTSQRQSMLPVQVVTFLRVCWGRCLFVWQTVSCPGSGIIVIGVQHMPSQGKLRQSAKLSARPLL